MSRSKTTEIAMPNESLTALSGYKHSPSCTLCNAKHPMTGFPVRGEIEEVYSRMGLNNAMIFANSMGISLSARSFQRHVLSHAPYVRAGAWVQKTKKLIKNAMTEHAEAEKTIQTIINVGTKLVEGGEMPVSEKLFIEALKMKNKEKKVIPLAGFITAVEGEVFDGEGSSAEEAGAENDQKPVKNE